MLAYAGDENGGTKSKIIIVNPTLSTLPFIKDISTDIEDIYEIDFNYNNDLIIACGRNNDKYQVFNIAS